MSHGCEDYFGICNETSRMFSVRSDDASALDVGLFVCVLFLAVMVKLSTCVFKSLRKGDM